MGEFAQKFEARVRMYGEMKLSDGKRHNIPESDLPFAPSTMQAVELAHHALEMSKFKKQLENLLDIASSNLHYTGVELGQRMRDEGMDSLKLTDENGEPLCSVKISPEVTIRAVRDPETGESTYENKQAALNYFRRVGLAHIIKEELPLERLDDDLKDTIKEVLTEHGVNPKDVVSGSYNYMTACSQIKKVMTGNAEFPLPDPVSDGIEVGFSVIGKITKIY